MKKIFSIFAAALFAGSMFAADELLFSQTYPGSPSKYTNGYDKTFTLTTTASEVNYTFTYANINNGQESNKWTSVRSGRKSDPSVATVTSPKIAAKVSKVSVTFTAVNAGKTNELYLLVADNADFTDAAKISATIAVGEVAFPITSPAENQYYQIVIDQAKHGSSNGFNQFSAVSFYVHKEVAVENPVIAGDADFFESVEVSISCVTDGAAIHYTLDGSDPTSESTPYSAPFTLTESKTVKAIAIKGTDKSEIVVKEFAIHPVFASIEALVEADLATGNLVKVSFEDARIDSVFTTKGGDKRGIYVDVKDKTGLKGIEIYYGSGAIPAAWEIGGKVSGTVVATWTLYNGQWEIVPAGDWAWTELTYKDKPTAVENIEENAKAVKFFENGQLVIIKNGVKYNATGAIIK